VEAAVQWGDGSCVFIRGAFWLPILGWLIDAEYLKKLIDPIAIFTAVLAVSTIALWRATKRQIELAREEFISTHRPKLIVRQFGLAAQPQHGDILQVEFSIVNIGDSDANWQDIGGEVALSNGREWETPIDNIVRPISRAPIRSGERVGAVIQSRFRITADQIRGLGTASLIICAVGELTYVDALGTRRRTGFRRHFDAADNRFVIFPSDDEYSD
jgi:hypothetical protein